MGEGLRLHGLGAVVEVRCVGAAADALESAMRVAWSRCLVPHGGSPVEAEPFEVRLDDAAELPRRMMLTTQQVTTALIRSRRGELLMLHAGAVSDPGTGRSLVYVARGGTGKTTLSQVLGRRLGYVTDETVGIDQSGAVAPYPKPLSVRRTDLPELKDEVSPDTLGLLCAPARPQATRVVLLERRPGTVSAELHELPLMDAVMALVGQTSALDELPAPLQRLAAIIDDVGPVMSLRYGDAADAQESLTTLLREKS